MLTSYPDHVLHDFKAALRIEIINKPLSDAWLMEYSRKLGNDILIKHGFDQEIIASDDAAALLAGSMTAELDIASYKEAIANVPDDLAIGFMPYDTSDGLKEVKWQDHYAYFIGLFKSSPIFESRDVELRNCFVGEETEKNKGFLKNFLAGLSNLPRLVVSGSDAHCFIGVKGDNDKRGYGDFPSGKVTWIKADPTFRGLQQAIMEPSKRSFIGERPPKQAEIEANKTFFIDRISVTKEVPAAQGTWLDGADVPLNPDLVAIIGNKGSGKSALADVVALLGNSRQKLHFSFLKKDRFRGKTGDPARNFAATLTWLDASYETRNLNDDPPADKVEMVRYIPQGHFEDLCNAHVTGRSDAFEKELRAVIFSHASEAIRLGALDFDQLKPEDLVSLTVNLGTLDAIAASVPADQERLKERSETAIKEKAALLEQQTALNAKLNAPQLAYQQNLKALEAWKVKLAELVGTPDAPETQRGLQARINQLDELPARLEVHRELRMKLAAEIFDVLEAQRNARADLFKPVQDLIQGNTLIREEYKLQFQATLGGSVDVVSAALFDLIKQNTGEFRGADEGHGVIRTLVDKCDFNTREGALWFISELHSKLAAAAGGKATFGIAPLLRKDKRATEVYDLLFGLSFLEPRYSLLFQEAQIEQLSPGQRGALLLIFYLLVDKGRNPIILDQPEENLDNETVVSLLVPVLTEAKKRRQIIMVTHNPNLAVVCDAEQVIWSAFDRKKASKISYVAGAIENPSINGHVVNVLEGTMPAFNNRRVKYHVMPS